MRSPIAYAGGKGNMVAKLLPLIPTHHIYCEPFFGGGSLFFAKAPAKVEIINDLNSDLVNMYRVLRDPDKFVQFQRLVSLTLYSREEFYTCRDTIQDSKTDVERAYKYFIKMRQSFVANNNGWGYNIQAVGKGTPRMVSQYLSTIERLPAIHDRLSKTQIEHNDFRKVIPSFDADNTFFYLDPPYITGERKTQNLYKHEMTDEDHNDLVNLLLNIKGKALLSCYHSALYHPLIKAGWLRKDYKTVCHMVVKTRNSGLQGIGTALAKVPRTETLLYNYEIQTEMEY